MTSKEKQNENLYEWISGILGQISNGYPLQRSDSKKHFLNSLDSFFSRFLFNNIAVRYKYCGE
jgi:hypothetical protein